MRDLLAVTFGLGIALAGLPCPTSAIAQEPKQEQLDCEDERNAEEEACLFVQGSSSAEFAPLIAPVVGLLGLALIAGAGSSGSTSTVSTD